MTEFICKVCGYDGDNNEFTPWYINGKDDISHYECTDYKGCKKRRWDPVYIKKREERENEKNEKLKEELKKKENDVAIEKELYKNMDKEEVFEAKYGFSCDELCEVGQRFRDGQTNYYHPETDTIYRWGMFTKLWSKGDDKFRKTLEKYGFDMNNY